MEGIMNRIWQSGVTVNVLANRPTPATGAASETFSFAGRMPAVVYMMCIRDFVLQAVRRGAVGELAGAVDSALHFLSGQGGQ